MQQRGSNTEVKPQEPRSGGPGAGRSQMLDREPDIFHYLDGRRVQKRVKLATWIQPNSLRFRGRLSPKGRTKELGSTVGKVTTEN